MKTGGIESFQTSKLYRQTLGTLSSSVEKKLKISNAVRYKNIYLRAGRMTGNIPTNITDMTEQEIQERLAILHQEKENRRKLIQGYESQVNKIAQRILESNTALKNLLKSLTELSTLTGDQKKKILQALENGPLSESELQVLMQAVLDKKTQNILKEKFGNKSLEEIKEIVKKEKDANYAKKISNAFWRITSTVAVTALCIRLAVGSPSTSEEDKQLPGTEQWQNPDNDEINTPITDTNPDQGSSTSENQNTEPPKFLTMQILQKIIPVDKLNKDENVSYSDVVNAVNSIQTERVRTQVIKYLMAQDIVGAQERFGMKSNSSYYSNCATGKLDRLSLYRFVDPMFDLYGAEITNNPDITRDIKNMYQYFLSGTYSNEGNPYIIVSGVDGRCYLFTGNHHLLNVQVMLSGKQNTAGFYRVIFNTMGIDKSGIEFVPGYMINGIYYSENGIDIPLDLMFINITTGEDQPEGYEGASKIYSIHATPKHLLPTRVAIMERITWLFTNKPPKYMIEVQQLIKQTQGCFNASYFSIIRDNAPAGPKGTGTIFVHT